MRSDPAQFDLTALPTLEATLALLSESGCTPLAGGTELMVAFNTGRLAPRSLVSIQHLRELRFIRIEAEAITIGAATTFTEIRSHAGIARDLPLLVQAASWTGTIANQNRATLGGNIVNASPAADTPPALLAYGAKLTLVRWSDGALTTRELPYAEFHLGYKRTAIEPGELLHSVTVPRRFGGYKQSLRKVGTRHALAISKVALAALARVHDDGTIEEMRLGAASLADRPLRCVLTEAAIKGQSIAPAQRETTIRRARAALASEARPIDDIRSTARYRSVVAGNLLEEFLRSLG